METPEETEAFLKELRRVNNGGAMNGSISHNFYHAGLQWQKEQTKTYSRKELLDFVVEYSGMERSKVERQFDKYLEKGKL